MADKKVKAFDEAAMGDLRVFLERAEAAGELAQDHAALTRIWRSARSSS